ncbi:MAG: hypothetical protein ABR503_06000 [Chitinophagaceae bacterium]
MLSTIFSRGKKAEESSDPDIKFGRYSDNNKSIEKVQRWNEADTFFKDKNYYKSITAFFDYLKDDIAENVFHEQKSAEGNFLYYQGSKIIKGFYNNKVLQAEVVLAHMPQPSVPVMRRLLEMNFALYYTRYAIKDDKLFMKFDSNIDTANPGKLYYGFKELATKADKQDDLLIQDFTTLLPVETSHIVEIPKNEKEIKYKYLQKWISETLELIENVDADKYSGGIAYLLLALAYRIDFLVVPEGKLLVEIEKIIEIYFKKDDRAVTQKNAEMMEEFVKIKSRKKEEVFPYLFRSRYTFSVVSPQNHKTIADAIYNANQNIGWYKENKHPDIAVKISEYGLAFCQYTYSLPRPITELFQLFMMINYPEFFEELGFNQNYYNRKRNIFNKEAILHAIENIQQAWASKYPSLKMKTDKLKFDDLVTFNQSFSTEIEFLNVETK